MASGMPGTPPPLPTSARRWGSEGRKGSRVSAFGDVQQLSLGAIGDSRQVHCLIRGQKQIQVPIEQRVLIRRKSGRRGGG